MATHWYVVQTKSHQEVVACANLERQGYVTYLPQLKCTRRRRGKWQSVTEPFFPRYLFIQLTGGEDDFSPIRSTIGVIKLLRFGEHPASISDDAIKTIKQQEYYAEQEQVQGQFPWKPGDRLDVTDGPFAGLSGIFEKQKNERVVILLDLLGRYNRILIESDKVVPRQL